MTHRRTLLRQAFVTQLRAAIPSLGQRVYSGRLMPIEEPELPAIVVHTREPEQVIDRSTSGFDGFERRRCIVSVIVVAQSYDDLDEDLDTMAQQVETALQAWIIPGFESADAMLMDTSSEPPDFDGSLTTNATTLRYAVEYNTPYRACSDPYVISDGSLEQSGAYPGGQVTPGCPGGGSGTVCPTGGATIIVNGTPS
jgi:hypothetical protein